MKTLKTDCGMEVTINPVDGVESRYANASKENRMKFAADMASVSFGRKGSKNPEKRWNEFFHEAVGEFYAEAKCSKCGDVLKFTGYENTADEYVYKLTCIKCGNEEKRFSPHKVVDKGWFNIFVAKEYTQDCEVRCGPSRPLENIPVKIYLEELEGGIWKIFAHHLDEEPILTTSTDRILDLMRHAYSSPMSDNFYVVHTNMRNLLQFGIDEKDIPYDSDIPQFVSFRIRAPYFVFAQIRTHGQLTQIAQSDRWSKENEYWLPADIEDRFKEKGILHADREGILKYLLSLPPLRAQEILKEAGYPLEIYQRWPNHMKFKEWTLSGYIDDDKSIMHFLLQRKAYPELIKDKTQAQTAQVSKMMRELLEWYMEEKL